MRIKSITAIDIQVTHHLKLLDARRQDRLIQSDNFIRVWGMSTINERKRILFLLKNIKPDKLHDYIKNKLEHKSMIELRRKASYYRIKNYSRKTRQQLLTEIEKNEK